jgi:hypothetical protein
MDKLKIGSRTMLHQVRRADKNRPGNKADNQDSSYAIFNPCNLRGPRVFEFAWNTCLELSERPPFSKDAGRNDCRPTEPGFVNYCDAGEWIASGYLHKTSFARHPWRSGTFTNHHGLLKEMRLVCL